MPNSTKAPARRWTEARIRSCGLQMNSMDAVIAVFNCGATKAKEVLRSGQELPFPVLRLGRRYVTPTSHVLRILGFEETSASAEKTSAEVA